MSDKRVRDVLAGKENGAKNIEQAQINGSIKESKWNRTTLCQKCKKKVGVEIKWNMTKR